MFETLNRKFKKVPENRNLIYLRVLESVWHKCCKDTHKRMYQLMFIKSRTWHHFANTNICYQTEQGTNAAELIVAACVGSTFHAYGE